MMMTDQVPVVIEAKNVDYFYPGGDSDILPALSAVNLTVKRGEYLALIGPNGSGKTTLLKLFNALLIPRAGEVLVDGMNTADENNLPGVRRTCGMIFQNPENQLVATTVAEDIAFGLENMALPSSQIRRKVHATAQLLGLKDLLDHPPHLLSGGEKQRVAVAGVAAMEPKCILMDEPTAMLDQAGRCGVLDMVRRLNRELKTAVVHVTHFLEEAAGADRVVVIDRGRVVADGLPRAILSDLDKLHGLGLAGTAAAELASLLREDGFNIPPGILYGRELVEILCSLEQKS